MFGVFVLIVLAVGCMITTPIAHSASLHDYRSAQAIDHNERSFLVRASWFQFACYGAGIMALIFAIWAGMIIGDTFHEVLWVEAEE